MPSKLDHIFSVLKLENSLGGDPGPGLGADSDFDRKQLEKVGVGSWNRFSASLANGKCADNHETCFWDWLKSDMGV